MEGQDGPEERRGQWIKDEKGLFAGSVGGGSGKSGGKSKGSDEISAQGANEFRVKDFVNKQKLNNHWQNGRTHQEEYAKDGITTKEQYVQRAVELVQSPCGDRIEGYKTALGQVCRYDTKMNDYVKGHPDKGIYTMFKPTDGAKYFERMKEKEGDGSDE